jgi:hypothetical protein
LVVNMLFSLPSAAKSRLSALAERCGQAHLGLLSACLP